MNVHILGVYNEILIYKPNSIMTQFDHQENKFGSCKKCYTELVLQLQNTLESFMDLPPPPFLKQNWPNKTKLPDK